MDYNICQSISILSDKESWYRNRIFPRKRTKIKIDDATWKLYRKFDANSTWYFVTDACTDIFQTFILFSRAGKKKDSFFLFCLVSCFCFFPCTTKLNLVEISLTLVGEDNFHTEDKTITNKEKFEDGRTFSNSTLHCYTSRGM